MMKNEKPRHENSLILMSFHGRVFPFAFNEENKGKGLSDLVEV